MKKMVMVFIVAVSGSMINAYQDNHLAQKERVQDRSGRFLDADRLVDEYDYSEQDQSSIDEYDQHICDDVKPPKISDAQAFLAKIVGRLLVHCFTIKETASIYYKELKEVISTWFNSVVKP